MKNVTFSAADELIESAREVARSRRTTLNQAFRDWLESYARPESAVSGFDALMERLSYVRPGRRFSRDEMNER